MDGFAKQIRVRFSGAGEENAERRVPIQKTYSFKGEKKKVQNWFERQFSGKMNGNYNDDSNDIEHAAAVAAVACAITSLEDSNRKKDIDRLGNETRVTKTKSKSKSKKEEDIAVIAARTSRGEGSRKSFDEFFEVPEMKEQMTSPENDKEPEYKPPAKRMPPKPQAALPKQFQPAVKKPETPAFPKPAQRSTKKPETSQPTSKPPASPAEIRKMGSTKPATETEADSWERTKMAKIKQKYERLNATVDSWEYKKKEKAKLKLEKSEKGKEKGRARALENYRNEMESIGQIAGGARAQALQKRRKEELKVKEKANQIRSTGEIPSPYCLCF